MTETSRLAMPLLVPGQASKELFHNAAVQIADALLCPVVQTMPLAAPPATPSAGQCFAIGSAATGAWAGYDGCLASWSEAGWLFVAVPDGSRFTMRDSRKDLNRTATGWEAGVVRADRVEIGGAAVVGSQQPAIANPSGGSVVDTQARSAINVILSAMRSHGLIAT